MEAATGKRETRPETGGFDGREVDVRMARKGRPLRRLAARVR
jgi:hypothetical protein